jgi:hypothetical protein
MSGLLSSSKGIYRLLSSSKGISGLLSSSKGILDYVTILRLPNNFSSRTVADWG